MPNPIQVVIDTNVVIAALISRAGASHQLIGSIGDSRWLNNVSAALLLEYEEQMLRQARVRGIARQEVEKLVNKLVGESLLRDIYFHWPDYVNDQDDRLVLDIAVAAKAEYIITFNVKNFFPAKDLNIQTILPGAFLKRL